LQAALAEQAMRDRKVSKNSILPAFDFDALHALGSEHARAGGRVDWDSDDSGWFSRFSSFGSGKSGSNFSDFLTNVLKRDSNHSSLNTTEFDSLGRSLKPDNAGKSDNRGWFDL
jgi:hypothetical protein